MEVLYYEFSIKGWGNELVTVRVEITEDQIPFGTVKRTTILRAPSLNIEDETHVDVVPWETASKETATIFGAVLNGFKRREDHDEAVKRMNDEAA